MERLTGIKGTLAYLINEFITHMGITKYEVIIEYKKLYARLALYENTGYSPQEITDGFAVLLTEIDTAIKAVEYTCSNSNLCEICAVECDSAGSEDGETYQCGCFIYSKNLAKEVCGGEN